MSDAPREPRFRLDLIIATLALLASASASIATVVQTRVVGNQLSAAVWPYLSFTTTTSPGSFVITLDNDGLGPALLRSVALSVDGRPQRRWRDALSIFRNTSKTGTKKAKLAVSFSEFGSGTVIRPATDFQVIRLESPAAPRIADESKRRVALKICYCSILQKCWRITLGVEGPPIEMQTCGTDASNLAY